MRQFLLLVFLGSLILFFGCSEMTTIGREECVDYQLRADYVNSHPDCDYGSQIVNGEIIRGMKREEVVASWGFPNVLLADDIRNNQHWVYYTKGTDEGSVLIYTLDFTGSDLYDWDIEIKRFTNFRMQNSAGISGIRERVSISDPGGK
ncbi:MAG: hypothetical protein U5O15_04870 [Candidatus Krumholzibacteriota bacterium]|nr:hypothetical protein [Candidatus Krumholzibacteriota bacterium]